MQIIPSPLKPRPRGARKKGRQDSSKEAPEASWSSNGPPVVTHGYYKSFDGTRLFYSQEGRGRPLVFCYGLICSSLHWTYQIEHFRRGYQAVWFDYRGHHNSDPPKDLSSLTLENCARDLGVLLDELGLEKPVILGHSMGVNVVLEFYRQQPDRVSALVLANGTAKRPLETMFRSNVFQPVFHGLKKIHDRSPALFNKFWKLQARNPLMRTAIALGGFNPYLTPREDIEMYVNQVAETDPRILMHLIESYDACDATAWLHTIRVPTLILGGEHDHLTPREQQELMHQLIPGSELAILRHGSHCPQMDLPELVNHRIQNFIERIGYAPSVVETRDQQPIRPGEAPVDPLPGVETLLKKDSPERLHAELAVTPPSTDPSH